MDCPSCGLANPPEAPKCDCGYDFRAGKAADFPGWEITLAWRQKVAAFWSISWPAWIGSIGLVIWLLGEDWIDDDNFSVIAIGGNLVFFAIQALLTRRLVRKNYRTFRLYVVRDGSKSRNLSRGEAFSIWLWILGPQIALLLLVSVAVSVWGGKLSQETIGALSSMSQWLRLLVIGPYAVDFALRRKYSNFRLAAHGFRYI
jgi:hypothetical protein